LEKFSDKFIKSLKIADFIIYS